MLSRITRLTNAQTGVSLSVSATASLLATQLNLSPMYQVRFGSKKKRMEKKAGEDSSSSGGSGANAKQLAQQREKVQLRLKQKREETRKALKLRQEASSAAQLANHMNVQEALRYLRAAEVGRSAHSTTISLSMRIVAEKGAHAVNGKCRLKHKLDDERIAVFTNSSEHAAEARKAGAAIVGGDDLIQKVKDGEINFDRAYATPDIVNRMNQQVARILGPKGLMPSAKRGTVTKDVYNTLKDASGEMTFKQAGTMLTLPVGRASFTNMQIVENIVTVVNSVRQQMAESEATSQKSAYLGLARITSTTGPAIVIAV